MNYCVEKIPFSEADVTQTEDWFLEKSRSGWYPVKIFGHRAIFEHAEPAETRYRLDPMESRCPPDRKRQRETGQDWRFVAMGLWTARCGTEKQCQTRLVAKICAGKPL